MEASWKRYVDRLTQGYLGTLLQEVASVVDSMPLYSSKDDVREPLPISPSMLLTLRTPSDVSAVSPEYTERDVCAYGQRRWGRVQFLADEF